MDFQDNWPQSLLDEFFSSEYNLAHSLNFITNSFNQFLSIVPATEFQAGFLIVANELTKHATQLISQSQFKATLLIINTMNSWLKSFSTPIDYKWSLHNLQAYYYIATSRNQQASKILTILRQEQKLYSFNDSFPFTFQLALTVKLASTINLDTNEVLSTILRLQQMLLKSLDKEQRDETYLLIAELYFLLKDKNDDYIKQAIQSAGQVVNSDDPLIKKYQSELPVQKQWQQERVSKNESEQEEMGQFGRKSAKERVLLEEVEECVLGIEKSGNTGSSYNIGVTGGLQFYFQKVKNELEVVFESGDKCYEHRFNLSDVQNDLCIRKNEDEGNFAVFLNEFVQAIPRCLLLHTEKNCLVVAKQDSTLQLDSFNNELAISAKASNSSLVYFLDAQGDADDDEIVPLIYQERTSEAQQQQEDPDSPIYPLLAKDEDAELDGAAKLIQRKYKKRKEEQARKEKEKEEKELEDAVLKIQRVYKKKQKI